LERIIVALNFIITDNDWKTKMLPLEAVTM